MNRITGASAGIGLATAQHFLDQGFRVVNLARRPCPLPQVQSFPVDLADGTIWDAVSEPLRQAIAPAERIILIHNAALLPADTVETVDATTLRTVMEVNIVAPTILNRLLLPLMPPGSAILYVGSTLSEKGVPGQLSYVTAKHALVGLMRATCQDLMGRQVHTACICPGLDELCLVIWWESQAAMQAIPRAQLVAVEAAMGDDARTPLRVEIKPVLQLYPG